MNITNPMKENGKWSIIDLAHHFNIKFYIIVKYLCEKKIIVPLDKELPDAILNDVVTHFKLDIDLK